MTWLKQPQKSNRRKAPKNHPLRQKESISTRRKKVDPPTQEEIDLAKKEFFESGKKVQKIEPLDIKSDSMFWSLDTDVKKSFSSELTDIKDTLTIINHDKS